MRLPLKLTFCPQREQKIGTLSVQDAFRFFMGGNSGHVSALNRRNKYNWKHRYSKCVGFWFLIMTKYKIQKIWILRFGIDDVQLQYNHLQQKFMSWYKSEEEWLWYDRVILLEGSRAVLMRMGSIKDLQKLWSSTNRRAFDDGLQVKRALFWYPSVWWNWRWSWSIRSRNLWWFCFCKLCFRNVFRSFFFSAQAL